MLGPSVLGFLAPGLAAWVFPAELTPQLGVIAQLGVILFMFLVGIELDLDALRRRASASLVTVLAGTLTPFLLGAVLALCIHPTLSSPNVPRAHFILFMGVSMAVTAFPVLARILADRRMQRSDLGVLALACAALGDAIAWCMLAGVVGVVHARGGRSVATLASTAVYVAVMWLVVQPAVRRTVRAQEDRGAWSTATLGWMLLGLLVSALVTEAIGIHALFGAFLLGAIVPHDSRVAREVTARIEDLTVALLLPVFFALTGLRTRIDLIHGASQWMVCGVILLVACVGKIGGTSVAARVTGLPWRDAGVLGVLMNTRGLMELIVLNVGLDLRIISPTLFAMLVLMAVVTTVLTAPLLDLLARRQEGRPAAQ